MNLVNSLTNILELPFKNDHVVVAPSPCSSLTDYHDKNVLVCCQDDSIDLISEFVLIFLNDLSIEIYVKLQF